MALPKQLTTCVVHFDGTTNKAYEVLLQDTDITVQYEFWTGGPYDEAISGKRLSNLRALRLGVDLSYQAAREDSLKSRTANTTGAGSTAAFNSFFNDFYQHFSVNNGESAKLYFGETLDNLGSLPNGTASQDFFNVVPTELTYQQTYTNQIGTFIPRISVTGQDLLEYIPTKLKGVL
jgi:hypothetical protein